VEIRNLEAVCLGARVKIHGLITNATSWRRLREPTTPGCRGVGRPTAGVRAKLARGARDHEKVRFSEAPRLEADFSLDARNPASLRTV